MHELCVGGKVANSYTTRIKQKSYNITYYWKFSAHITSDSFSDFIHMPQMCLDTYAILMKSNSITIIAISAITFNKLVSK